MPKITLTFDNGPDPDVTPEVLDTLRCHNLKASFFVLGEKLRERRYLAERAHGEGHWIGNHTYNHLLPLGRSGEPTMATVEIERTQDLIGDLAHARRFFRPFGGGGGGKLDHTLLNQEAATRLVDGGYTCVLWNAVAEDWVYPTGWVEKALERCFALDHAVLVLHDLPTGAMASLDRFIRTAQDRGAVFIQDFAKTCVPIEQGCISGEIEPLLVEGEWLVP